MNLSEITTIVLESDKFKDLFKGKKVKSLKMSGKDLKDFMNLNKIMSLGGVKAKKLSSDDTFTVKNPTSVAGVRG